MTSNSDSGDTIHQYSPSGGSHEASGKRIQVAIVDDDPMNIEFLRAALSCVKCDVHVASDGEEAWLLINQIRPDLMMVDLRMPRLNGLDLFLRIKASTQFESIPVVAMTGELSELSRSAMLDIGFRRFLTKPVRLKEIRQSLEELYSSTEQQAKPNEGRG